MKQAAVFDISCRWSVVTITVVYCQCWSDGSSITEAAIVQKWRPAKWLALFARCWCHQCWYWLFTLFA